MTPETVLTLGQRGMELAIMVAAPPLLTGLAVGVLVSLFQAATQINEMTLTFVPKLLAIAAAMLLIGPWMLNKLIDFTVTLFRDIPTLIG